MADIEVRRLSFGYFVRPADETESGAPRVEPCLGYLVVHEHGTLLLDTGMGSTPWVEHHYRPRRQALAAALAGAGISVDDVTLVTNCHLHFDHCGGNPELVGRPVFVQATELAEARSTADYTMPGLLAGSRFEEVEGEHEVRDGTGTPNRCPWSPSGLPACRSSTRRPSTSPTTARCGFRSRKPPRSHPWKRSQV